MKSALLHRFFVSLLGLLTLNACASGGNSMSLDMWIAADVDIAVAYVHLPDGRLLYRQAVFYPYQPSFPGWQEAGPEVLSFVKTLPDHVMVSWRRPPAVETPYERCRRRAEPVEKCAVLSGRDSWNERDDGELIGPIKVPIRSRLSEEARKLLDRPGTFNTLSLGIGIGLERPILRWRLRGTPAWAAPLEGGVSELGKGGDW